MGGISMLTSRPGGPLLWGVPFGLGCVAGMAFPDIWSGGKEPWRHREEKPHRISFLLPVQLILLGICAALFIAEKSFPAWRSWGWPTVGALIAFPLGWWLHLLGDFLQGGIHIGRRKYGWLWMRGERYYHGFLGNALSVTNQGLALVTLGSLLVLNDMVKGASLMEFLPFFPWMLGMMAGRASTAFLIMLLSTFIYAGALWYHFI